MKKLLTVVNIIVSTGLLIVLSSLAQAQTLQDKFDFIVDQAESIYPEIFPPTQETFAAEELGFSWFARFYPATGVYAALNIDESAIYTLGGPWPEPTLQGDLDAILASLGYSGGGGSSGGGDDVNEIVDIGSGQCVMRQLPVQGTVAVYNLTSMDPDASNEMTGTFTTAYTMVSANSITTENEFDAMAEDMLPASNTVVTTMTRVENGWVYQTDLETVTNVEGQQFQQTTTYEPDLFVGPEEICTGQAWRSAAVTSLTDSGIGPLPPTETVLNPTSTNVISINDVIEVAAGSFTTVNMVVTTLEGDETQDYAINWFNNELGGIPVRSESYDENDNLLSVTELTSVTVP